MKNSPLVAVFMVTYNHEQYISEAIESVLSQETTFDFQLFIGDDASTDKTVEVCSNYLSKYPERITLFRRESNRGVFENANLLFQECLASGAKYIAMLEGDDFWNSCVKLQSQIDLLEKNQDVAGAYHNTYYLYPDGAMKPMKESVPELMELGNVISKYSPFHTSSFVFRSKHFSRPSWFKMIDSVDLAMYVWHAQFGKFQGINQCMSVYRLHQSSLTAGQSQKNYFDDRRLILHRMMQGKIQHQSFAKYRELIRFHETNSKGVWRQGMPETIGFFFQENSMNNFQYQLLRMGLEAPILNFGISANGALSSQDFQFGLFNRFYFYNYYLWRRLVKRMSESFPSSLFFLDELSFYRFKKYFGSNSMKIFILFPLSVEKFKIEKSLFDNLELVDWHSKNEKEQTEFLNQWNVKVKMKE